MGDEPRGRRFVLAIGTEERRKDLPRLVAAFDAVAADDGEVTLVIAGAPGDASTGLDEALVTLRPAAAGRVLRLGRSSAPQPLLRARRRSAGA